MISPPVDTLRIDQLFASVCETMRESIHQSREAIVRDSKKRITSHQDDWRAANVLAAASLARNNPRESLRLLGHHHRAMDQDATGNRLAAYASLVDQQHTEAQKYLDRSVRLDPHLSDCWNLLGQLAERQGLADDAIRYYQRAMVIDDSEPDSAIALSRIHTKRRNLADAIHTLRVGLLGNKRSPQLNLALARLLAQRAAVLGRRKRAYAQTRLREEALSCYRTVNASTGTAATLVAQGQLEQQLSLLEAARRSFERATELDPDDEIARTHLANANVDCGNIDGAIEQFQRVIERNPRRAAAHFGYARAKRFHAGQETDRYIDHLRRQASEETKEKRQVYFQFALAKVLEDTGRYDEAWTHYERGNYLKPGHSRSTSRQKKEAPAKPPLQQLTDHSVQFFTSDRIEEAAAIADPTDKPIFIVGMPRSGTTLTEQILSSHPRVAGGGELDFINRIRQELIHEHASDRPGAQPPEWNLYPNLLAATTPPTLRHHASRYLALLDSISPDVRVTDKMPTNFMHLGLIAMLFPGATVIHCRRNPMDVLVSCYCQNLNAPFCDLEQLLAYHRNYRRLMRHWETVLPINLVNSRYESLVENPQQEIRRLLGRCGLDWNDQCMAFHKNSRAVRTPSKWQVRQPMYSSSVEKWRRFEKHLAPTAERLEAELAAEG